MIKTSEIPSPIECAERILGYLPHGLRAVKTLQAQCRLLQALPPVPEEQAEDLGHRVADLTQAIAGMGAHLQTLYDVVDSADMYATDIVETGDELADAAPLIRYLVCIDVYVDSKKDYPFERGGTGTEHPTLSAAFTELRHVRRNYPKAYVARLIYQRCADPVAEAVAEPVAETKTSKKKLRAA